MIMTQMNDFFDMMEHEDERECIYVGKNKKKGVVKRK